MRALLPLPRCVSLIRSIKAQCGMEEAQGCLRHAALHLQDAVGLGPYLCYPMPNSQGSYHYILIS